MTTLPIDKNFVYDNIEVKLTGRKALKKLRSNKVSTLVEIQPADLETGSWKKWVAFTELYQILDEQEDT